MNRLSDRCDNTEEDWLTLDVAANQKLNELYCSYRGSACAGDWLAVDAARSVEFIVSDIYQYLSTGSYFEEGSIIKKQVD